MNARLAVCMLSALLAGCASTPANRYYTLSAVPPTASPALSTAGAPTIASLRLPALLDRLPIVVRTGPQTVDVREYDRWAEPLDQMAMRILATDLTARSAAANGAVSSRRLFVVLDDFMCADDGQCALSGRWWILSADEDAQARREQRFALTQPAGAGPIGQTAALGTLLAALADQISAP